MGKLLLNNLQCIMDGLQDIPPIFAQQNEQSNLEQIKKDLLNSTKEVNKYSDNYRKTIIGVHEKLIFLSGGSISLLLTFLGVLFSNSKTDVTLRYETIILSIFAFLITIIFLLVSGWLRSLYLFSMTHEHYLTYRKNMHESELRLMSFGSTFVNAQYKVMDAQEIDKQIKQTKKFIKEIDKQIKIDSSKVKKYHKLANISAVTAYITFTLAYVFATVFFLGVIEVMGS